MCRKERKKLLVLWRSQQLIRQKGRCHYCNCKMDTTTYGPGEYIPSDAMTIDHVIPRSLGGTNEKKNLVLACFQCNKIKGSTLLESNLIGKRS